MLASLNRTIRTSAAIALVALLAAGCERDNPVATSSSFETPGLAPALTTSFVSTDVVINYYAVHFNGRTYADGKTTFSYTVTGTGVDPSLSHFAVELPACAGAPVAYSPTGSANINTNQSTGIYGLEWHLSVAKDNLAGRTYTMTFNGDVALGIVRAEVQTEGGASAVGSVFGPCAGSHITGKVFVDADKTGTLTNGEAGIANVTVMVSNGSSSVTALTDASGDYDFLVANGSYTLSVPAATAATDFNEDLYASFSAFSATSLPVSVSGSNSPNHNFAFSPQSDNLKTAIETGVILTDGKDVRFWKSELKSAITGGGQHTYTAAQVTTWVQQIQAFGLATPFQFTPGKELQDALAILSVNSKTDYLGQLLKQLLAAELNFFSGNTLVGEADLHEVLILWGEELAVQPVTTTIFTTTGTGTTKIDPYASGTGLLGTMNGSTGGGGGDE
ncbi:MAG TPA: SdrD B-like domain-containing protein [Candidatus Krumholzibacteria bacterium]|nr:SdrD B-like domain-containing protein [Candidatus Krumholzibacteria bacterium]